MRKIDPPYNTAFTMPCRRLCALFVKKETVSGIRGNTQGKRRARRPAPRPTKNRVQRLLSALSSSPHELTGCLRLMPGTSILDEAAIPPSSGTENENEVEG